MRVFVIPDMHVPYHDVRVWRLMLAAIRTTLSKGDKVIIIGDFADFYRVSFHAKAPHRQSFETEIEAVYRELDALYDICTKKGIDVVYLEGNHEHRLERYLVDKAPDLFGLVSCADLFDVQDRGWIWRPYRSHYRVGKMHYTHDVGRAGKQAAAQSLADFGGNLTFGHTHRGGVVYAGTLRGETHVCLNVGWGGDYSQVDYMHDSKALREWQHGAGLVDYDGQWNCFAQFLPVVGGKFYIDGSPVRA